MPVVTAVFAAARFFLGTKAGRILGLVLLVSLAFGVWTWRVYEHGYTSANAKIEEKTAAESTRRVGVLDSEHERADRVATGLREMGERYAALETKLDQALAGRPNPVCLDASAYSELRASSGRPASGGVGQPEGKSARRIHKGL